MASCVNVYRINPALAAARLQAENLMTEPAAVDSLNGQICKPEKATFSGGWWKIEDLPPTDDPLVITDKSVAQA